MKEYRFRYLTALFLFSLLITNCQKENKPSDSTDIEANDPISKSTENELLTNPCTNPITVAELKTCASSIGVLAFDSISTGEIVNGNNCLKSWNDDDTLLFISYQDSVDLWRVGEWQELPGKMGGSWFSNFNAQQAGMTKAEVLNQFAITKCSEFNYDSCFCAGTQLPNDTLIQYEDHVRFGAGKRFIFGVVGKNEFGEGGQMQWNALTKDKPPFRLLEQVRWE